jgi:hypothetical protein
MFEAMSNGVAAKEEAVYEFAQLNGYCQKVWGIHGVVDTVVAPAIDAGCYKRAVPCL